MKTIQGIKTSYAKIFCRFVKELIQNFVYDNVIYCKFLLNDMYTFLCRNTSICIFNINIEGH